MSARLSALFRSTPIMSLMLAFSTSASAGTQVDDQLVLDIDRQRVAVDLSFGAAVDPVLPVLADLSAVDPSQAYVWDLLVDPADLLFLESNPIAPREVSPGVFGAQVTTQNADGQLPNQGRVSVLRVSTEFDPLFFDGRNNSGAGDGLVPFELNFRVLDVIIDGMADLTLGFLEASADANGTASAGFPRGR